MVVSRRIILTNEFRATAVGSQDINRLSRSIDALAEATSNAKKRQRELNDKYGFSIFSQSKLLRMTTQLRIEFFNLALIAGLVGGTITAVFGPAVKLENQMAAVRKTTGLTGKSLDELEQSFLRLSTQMPISADELAGIGAVAGQLGISGTRNIEEFTKVVAMMSTATELSSQDAATALAKLSQAFDLPISNIEHLGSTINELSNTTAATAGDIVNSMTRAAAAANQLGISAEFVAAFSATLIASGQNAERVGTRLQTAFTMVAQNIDKVSVLLGKTPKDIEKALGKNSEKVVMDIVRALANSEDGVVSLQKSTEIFGRVGAKAISGAANSFIELQRNIITASDSYKQAISLQTEFNLAMDTTTNQFKLLVNNLVEGMSDFSRAGNSAFGNLLQLMNKNIERGRVLQDIFESTGGKGPLRISSGMFGTYANPTIGQNNEFLKIAEEEKRIRKEEGDIAANKFLVEQKAIILAEKNKRTQEESFGLVKKIADEKVKLFRLDLSNQSDFNEGLRIEMMLRKDLANATTEEVSLVNKLVQDQLNLTAVADTQVASNRDLKRGVEDLIEKQNAVNKAIKDGPLAYQEAKDELSSFKDVFTATFGDDALKLIEDFSTKIDELPFEKWKRETESMGIQFAKISSGRFMERETQDVLTTQQVNSLKDIVSGAMPADEAEAFNAQMRKMGIDVDTILLSMSGKLDDVGVTTTDTSDIVAEQSKKMAGNFSTVKGEVLTIEGGITNIKTAVESLSELNYSPIIDSFKKLADEAERIGASGAMGAIRNNTNGELGGYSQETPAVLSKIAENSGKQMSVNININSNGDSASNRQLAYEIRRELKSIA